MEEKRKFVKPKELILIFVMLFMAVGLLLFFLKEREQDKNALQVHIYYFKEEVAVYPLTKDRVIKTDDFHETQYHPVIEIKDGKVAFTYSECPDQVCVKSGWLSNENDITACLPAGYIIHIQTPEGEIVTESSEEE